MPPVAWAGDGPAEEPAGRGAGVPPVLNLAMSITSASLRANSSSFFRISSATLVRSAVICASSADGGMVCFALSSFLC